MKQSDNVVTQTPPFERDNSSLSALPPARTDVPLGKFLCKKMSMNVIQRREVAHDERLLKLGSVQQEERYEIFQKLAGFVPHGILQTSHQQDPDQNTTVMLCDLSGFTSITERYTMDGTSGLVSIHELINSVFEESLRIVDENGGDVIHFAGDALIVRWMDIPNAKQCEAAGRTSVVLHQMDLENGLQLHVAIAATRTCTCCALPVE